MTLPLLTRVGTRALDQALISAGVPGVLLMENAGRGAAELIASRVNAMGLARAALLVGPGNNGGDGYVVARHLREICRGLGLRVLSALDPAEVRGDAAVMRDAWRAVGGVVSVCPEGEDETAAAMEGCDLVIDALFGTGLDRPLSGAALALVRAANASAAPRWRVALDLPSGLDADTGSALGDEHKAFAADETLTFGVSKPGLHTGLGRRLSGTVTVVGLGASLPRELLGTKTWLHVPEVIAPRAIDAHKGLGGHVLVVGGSEGRTGAALLCAQGAHRAGAGLVTLASRAGQSLEARVLESMCLHLAPGPTRAREVLAEALTRVDAVVLGPGLGSDEWARAVVDLVLRRAKVPVVIDADALAIVAGRSTTEGVGRPEVMVLTPHPLEMARIMEVTQGPSAVNADRLGAARAASHRFNAWVVLKGAGTVVSTPDLDVYVMPFAEPTLAVAGSGDVLAGAIAARLAERGAHEPTGLVLEAVSAHGLAGERVRAARGSSRGALAREIADALSYALEGRSKG